jgi:predicted nucleic acid-binding protein
MPLFEKGRAKTGGRKKGVRNKPKPFEVVMAKLEQVVKDRAALEHDNRHGQDLLDRLAAAMYRYRNYVIIHNDPKYRRCGGVLLPRVKM